MNFGQNADRAPEKTATVPIGVPLLRKRPPKIVAIVRVDARPARL